MSATYGTVIHQRPLRDDEIAPTLPPELAGPLAQLGAAGFHDGLFWTVSPAEGAALLEPWVDLNGQATVFLRSAFGDLFFWYDGRIHRLDVNRGRTQPVVKDPAQFFGRFLHDPDIHRVIFKRELFAQCREGLGALAEGECYAATPDGLTKAGLREQLEFLCEMHTAA